MHSVQASRAQGPVRKQTRDQKQQCVAGQEIVCQRIRGSKRDNDADQSNNGQANADHCGRDSEDVNANVLPEVAVCATLRVLFSFIRQYLDWLLKRLFRIARLILSLALALAPALAHSDEMKPQFDHEKHQWSSSKVGEEPDTIRALGKARVREQEGGLKFINLTRRTEIGANSYYLEMGGYRLVLDCGMHPKEYW